MNFIPCINKAYVCMYVCMYYCLCGLIMWVRVARKEWTIVVDIE